ncbi:MAG: sulfurtransferase [Proteobacteria bacterium]|nr:MAG: sulfurtransferase [Pseudomonadota bacterium]
MQHDPDFETLVNEIRPQIKEYTIEEVQDKFANGDQFVFIDVREDHEWSAGHIPHAIHVGRGILERDIATKVANKDIEIVLYCGGGFRSALSAYNLQKMGYKNVSSMDGGIRGWKERNLPLE